MTDLLRAALVVLGVGALLYFAWSGIRGAEAIASCGTDFACMTERVQ